MVRVARIDSDNVDVAHVEAFLPDNYTAVLYKDDGVIEVVGRDVAGWTLDGYVIPRLASGMIFAREVV